MAIIKGDNFILDNLDNDLVNALVEEGLIEITKDENGNDVFRSVLLRITRAQCRDLYSKYGKTVCRIPGCETCCGCIEQTCLKTEYDLDHLEEKDFLEDIFQVF